MRFLFFLRIEVNIVAEPNKQQIGDGGDNIGQAARKTAEAAKQISKAAAEKAAVAGAEATSTAAGASVAAAAQGGQAAASVAAGTAAGGPVGAVLAAAWAMRHTLFKILVCICLVLVFFITAIVSLPSIVFNNIFHTDPDSIDYASGDIYEIMEELSGMVSGCVTNGYDAALAKVEKAIEDGGYDYELSMEALINHGYASATYDICYILAAYSASMEQRGTTKRDMEAKLNSVADKMFPVTYVEKEMERVIPLTYTTYSAGSVTVITGKTQTGTINGVPQYRYTTGTHTYYTPSGEATTTVPVTRTAYQSVSVEVPVYTGSAVTGSRTETYYTASGTETLTPDTEMIKYIEATIGAFDQSVILKAFNIDPNAVYNQFNITYAEAIQNMANALKRTLYGTTVSGNIPSVTDEELLRILNSLNCSGARKALIQAAFSLVGKVPYFWGGKSSAGWNDEWNTPKLVSAAGSSSSGTVRPYGLDCSGFTDWVYKTALGETIGAGTTGQWGNSAEISYRDLKPGDLGFKDSPYGSGINHVLIYVGKDGSGNDLWVHCSSGSGVVVNSPGYIKYYRRVNNIDLESNTVSGGSYGEALYTIQVDVTHYCACTKCCGSGATGTTASGKQVAVGMVAMSSHYPFGTQIMINGTMYTVEDRGGSGIENDTSRVDIYVPDHQQALRMGRYKTTATIYRLGR